MGWILRTGTGLDELSRYEAQVNRLFLDRRVAGMCLYDRRLFAPEQLRTVAAAHPATVGPYAERGWAPLLWAYRTADPPCPYDAARLDPVVLAEARCTHPVLVDRAGRRPSAGYAPADVVARHNKPLPVPDEQVATFRYDLETLPRVRRFVADHAAGAGLDAERIADLQIAVTELATNSVAHAGGAGTLQVWLTGTHLVCEIHDDGWLADPLAGRLAPAHDGIGGRGRVIVYALCDLVRVHTTAAGTTVRLYMLREALA